MSTTDKFSQRNPLWNSRPLGTRAGSTIGQHGCLLCSAARLVYRLLDEVWTPWELNRALTEANGFEDGNLMRHEVLAQLTGLRFVSREDYHDKLFRPEHAWEVEGRLREGAGVLIQVDSSPFAPGVQEHWVALETVEDNPRCAPYRGWEAYDPWHGEVVEIGQYYAPYGRKLDYAVWVIVTYEAT